MRKPSADDRYGLPTRKRQLFFKLRCKSDDIVRPKDRLYLADIRFIQIRLTAAFHAIYITKDGGISRRNGDVCTVGLQLLIDFIADVEHNVQHGGSQRNAERNRECDEYKALSLTNQRSFYHLPKQTNSPLF